MRTPEAVAKRKGAVSDLSPSASGISGVEGLRRLRQEQLELLAHAAADDPALVNGILARVQSLSAAIDLLEKTKSKKRDRRLTMAAWVAAVLLTGTLLLLHRPSAEILADTTASQLSFTVTRAVAPLRGLPGVKSVELSGLAEVQQDGSPWLAAGPDEDLRLRIEADAASKNPGSIGFDQLTVPAGTQIEISSTGEGKTIGLRLQYPSGKPAALDLAVTGDVMIRSQGQRRTSFAAPAQLTAVPVSDGELAVELGSKEVAFPTPIAVQSVSWNRRAFSDPVHPGGARAESSILSGKLSLEEFKDRTINLRNGEVLQAGGASGQIRQLRSDGVTISSQFDGSVKELAIGEGVRRRNLMPTWLDWIRQQDALVQFWAIAAYLAGIGLTMGRWWKESK
jgi:hypothetical protein